MLSDREVSIALPIPIINVFDRSAKFQRHSVTKQHLPSSFLVGEEHLIFLLVLHDQQQIRRKKISFVLLLGLMFIVYVGSD